jgi:hypothetical protein
MCPKILPRPSTHRANLSLSVRHITHGLDPSRPLRFAGILHFILPPLFETHFAPSARLPSTSAIDFPTCKDTPLGLDKSTHPCRNFKPSEHLILTGDQTGRPEVGRQSTLRSARIDRLGPESSCCSSRHRSVGNDRMRDSNAL